MGECGSVGVGWLSGSVGALRVSGTVGGRVDLAYRRRLNLLCRVNK